MSVAASFRTKATATSARVEQTKAPQRFEMTLHRSFAGSDSATTTSAPRPNPKRTKEEKMTIATRMNTL